MNETINFAKLRKQIKQVAWLRYFANMQPVAEFPENMAHEEIKRLERTLRFIQ